MRFFDNLFSGRKSQKRLSAFAQRLKALQDHLGALNDIKVTRNWRRHSLLDHRGQQALRKLLRLVSSRAEREPK